MFALARRHPERGCLTGVDADRGAMERAQAFAALPSSARPHLVRRSRTLSRKRHCESGSQSSVCWPLEHGAELRCASGLRDAGDAVCSACQEKIT